MTIIVAGKIYVKPGRRGEFIKKSLDAIYAARQTEGCRDFSVSPDPVEVNRVNIYEEWRSERELVAFRGSGPTPDLAVLIEEIHVTEHRVDDSSG